MRRLRRAAILPGIFAAFIYVSVGTAGKAGAEVFYGSAVWGGARNLAMGEAGGAVLTDAESVFQTPAGIARAENPSFVLGHTVWGEETPTETGAAVLPLGNLGTLGFAGFYQSLGNIEERNYRGELVGTFSLDTYAATAIYALPVTEALSAGVSGGVLDQQGAELGGQDIPLGAGLLWKGRQLSLGASGMDLLSEFPVYQVSASYGLAAAGVGVLVTGGGIFRENDDRLGIGAELKLNPVVSLRGGYQMPLADSGVDGLKNFSAGVGLQYATMGLDYGFLPLGDIGQVHRFQVGFRFSGAIQRIADGKGETLDPAASDEPVMALLLEEEYQRAVAEFKAGEYHGALARIHRILQADPEHWRAWALLGNYHYKMDEMEAARKAYERSLEIYPENHRLRRWMKDIWPDPAPLPAAAMNASAGEGAKEEVGVEFVIPAGSESDPAE